MALGQIAPWLQLPDFMGSVHAGASIGLQQRKAADDLALDRTKLAQQAQEAAGRLSLGFTEATTAAQKAKAEQDLAKAALALHQGRNSDLSKQADDRHQLGEKRLDALEANRGVVNDLHQDALDHRVEVDALRGTRLPGSGSRATGTPAAKPYMVKVPVPANPETGEAATTISLPSTHPAAQAYLKAHGMGEIPPESVSELYTPDLSGQSGETLPLPGPNGPGVKEVLPRNNTYMGAKTDSPVFEPKPLPPEELQGPSALPAENPLSKDVAATFLKQAKGDRDAARKLARAAGYTF